MPQFQFLPENASFGSQLGRQLGMGAGMGLAQGLQNQLGAFQKTKELEAQEEMFRQQGYPDDLARLAAVATTGGQTEVLKQLLEMRQRGEGGISQVFEESSKVAPLDKDLGSFSFAETDDIEVEEPNFAKATRGMTEKERQDYIAKFNARSFERNKKYLDRISEIAGELPKEKAALEQMRGALNSGDFNSLRNTLADLTGQEWLKSASAQTVNAATKQYLMASLSGLTGRPNQFIEQQITKATINPQYRDAANSLIFEGMKGLADLKEKETEIALKIESQFARQGKEVPRNLQQIVRREMKKEADKFEKEYEKSVREKLKGIKVSPQEVAQELLREAKGDKELARKLAKERGYQF